MMIITIVLLEVGLRLFGFSSYELPEFSMISSPSRHITPDSQLGVRLNPGTYQVALNKKLKYKATHLENGYRTCGDSNVDGPLVAFYGCSFTYGTGVNDHEVYPHLLQEKFDSLKIENRAVPGYGQAQMLVNLENEFKKNGKPKLIVLNYLSFHNERNSMNPAYQQKLRTGYEITKKEDKGIAEMNCSYPYGEIVDGELKMRTISIQKINSTLPLITYSAITNSLQNVLDQKNISESEDEKVTLAMISVINTICKNHNVQLVISCMSNDEMTTKMVSYCKEQSIPTIDIFVDLTQEGFTNAPYDQHPSAIAHEKFAEKLYNFMKGMNLTK